MRQQRQLMWLWATPLAQPQPPTHQRPLVMYECGGGGFEHRHIPCPPATCPCIGEFIHREPFSYLHTSWGAGVIEAEQAPRIARSPPAKLHVGVRLGVLLARTLRG